MVIRQYQSRGDVGLIVHSGINSKIIAESKTSYYVYLSMLKCAPNSETQRRKRNNIGHEGERERGEEQRRASCEETIGALRLFVRDFIRSRG